MDAHLDPVGRSAAHYAAQHERHAFGVAAWDEAQAKAVEAGVTDAEYLDRWATGAGERFADAEQKYAEIVASGSHRDDVLAWAREEMPMFSDLDDDEFADEVAFLEEVQGYPVTADGVLAFVAESVGDELVETADRLAPPDDPLYLALPRSLRRVSHVERAQLRAAERRSSRRPLRPVAASRPREHRSPRSSRATRGSPGRPSDDDPDPDDVAADLAAALARRLREGRR